MSEKDFRKKAIQFIKESYAEEKEFLLNDDSIYCVWLCKILQNNKGLFATTREDNLYFEVTYNGDKNEMYVDMYKKKENCCIKL